MTLGAHQTINYDNVVTNIGNAYDKRYGHFVASVPGLYSFSVTAMAFGKTAVDLYIVKNNARLVRVYTNEGYSDFASITVHTHVDVGDHVWVETYDRSGDRLQGGSYNCFSGILDNVD